MRSACRQRRREKPVAVLNETSEAVNDVVIIGHDPGVQGLADVLAGEAEDDAQVPINRSGFLTSALAVLTFTGSWQDLEPSSGCLADFGAPKAV